MAYGRAPTEINFLNEWLDKASTSTRVEFWRFCVRHVPYIMAKCYTIQAKDKALKPLIANYPQRRFLSIVLWLWLVKRVPVRISPWLKARQIGATTIVSALINLLCRFIRGFQAFIMANEDQTTRAIFNRHRVFNAHIVNKARDGFPMLAHPVHKENSSEIILYDYNPELDLSGQFDGFLADDVFEDPGVFGFVKEGGSRITLKTAGMKSVGKVGETFQFIHNSEIGDPSVAWGDVVGPTDQQVPYLPDTFIIREGTTQIDKSGRIMGSTYLQEQWNKGTDISVDYKHGFVRIFDPFFIVDEYRLDLEDGEDIPPFGYNDKERARDELEQQKLVRRMEDYWNVDHLPPARSDAIRHEIQRVLKWRYYVGIRELCDGDINLFHSQYPSYPEEAFVSKASGFFSGIDLSDRLEFIAELEGGEWRDSEYPKDVSLRNDGHNHLRIFRPHDPSVEYLMVSDHSYGTGSSDPSAALIFNTRDFSFDATWMSDIDSDGQSEELSLLGWMFHTTTYDSTEPERLRHTDPAIAIPEANNVGLDVIRDLMSIYGYPRVWPRKPLDAARKANKSSTIKYGFLTDETTRPIALSQLKVQFPTWLVYDKRIIQQMANFQYNKQNKPVAAGGHDELVTCLWITAYVCRAMKYLRDVEWVPQDHRLLQEPVTFHERIFRLNQARADVLRLIKDNPLDIGLKFKLNEIDMRIRELELSELSNIQNQDAFRRSYYQLMKNNRSSIPVDLGIDKSNMDWRGSFMKSKG